MGIGVATRCAGIKNTNPSKINMTGLASSNEIPHTRVFRLTINTIVNTNPPINNKPTIANTTSENRIDSEYGIDDTASAVGNILSTSLLKVFGGIICRFFCQAGSNSAATPLLFACVTERNTSFIFRLLPKYFGENDCCRLLLSRGGPWNICIPKDQRRLWPRRNTVESALPFASGGI